VPVSASTRTAIVADTTSYLPRELLERHDVHPISLYVGLEGVQEREEEITDLSAFYERLRTSGESVTTSQPSVGDFLAVYEPLLAEGREIVSIHLAAGISGTYESAVQACERLTADGKGGERIHVCDSRTGAGGMGLMILGAARAAERGASGAETKAAADEVRANLKIWFAVDTLEYLRRGGRIGAARAWIGSTLAIKPILTGLQIMPSVAWVPAAIIWFGLSDATYYAVVLLGAVPSIAIGLISGVDQIPPLFHRVGRVLGRAKPS